MKVQKLVMLILFLSLFIQCENSAQYTDTPQYAQLSNAQEYAAASNSAPIEMKPIRDPKTGRITSYLPLPADWRTTTSNYGMQGFEGPNGIKVNFLPAESYYFNIDPYVAQMSGKTVANPVDLETIFRERLAPSIQQQGGKFIEQYTLPEVSQRSHQLLQRSLNRSRIQSYSVLASDWQQANGYRSMVLMTQGIAHAQAGSNWWISLTEVEAPAQYFEQAKETYLFALANWQVDQNSAMAYAADLNRIDRESEQRLANSRAAFNARMQQNEAAFQAQQRSHVATSNAISDLSMQGYWSRAESNDRLRNQEVNAIHEENTMTNPWDNRSMQVQSGYQTYYINSQGDIIGSNDANFNPNVNSNYNHTEWRKMPNRY